MPLEISDDDDLLRAMAAGSEEAFASLYRRHQARVFRFALHMSGSAAIAEEVTQEVFVLMMREVFRYDSSRGALAAFLLGVARNHVRRCLEREGMYVTAIDDPEDGSFLRLASADDVLGDLTRRETQQALRKAVLSLPENYREVVVLCELNEMDYAEAATVLGCPLGTVRSRLHRARVLLVGKLRAFKGCPA
jgi:RNA polymerase sigma-70 factor (ECF subfamily)